MAIYSLNTVQRIPDSLSTVWDFFSSPGNLPLITPPSMNFRITSRPWDGKVYAGQIIEYKVNPLPFWTAYWMTEITHLKEGSYFVDEQRFGPYSLWHHQHHFKEIPGGVEMTDIVHYKNPFWWIGDLANTLFVKKQLEEVFSYRNKKVEERFGKWGQ